LLQGAQNHSEDTVELSVDLVVSKSQNTVTCLSQNLIPDSVAMEMILEGVLASVDLDDEPGAAAFEIDDVWRGWRLSPEVMAQRPQFAQTNPQFDFLRRHLFAKRSCSFARHVTSPWWSRPTRHQSQVWL
jgi:hypothetical protein